MRDAGSPAAHAYQPDALLRTSTESSYTGNNVYNTTGTGQSKTLSTLANTAVSVVYKVQNDGDASDILTVMGTAGGSGWTVRYYTAAGEITSQVTGAGWNTGSLAAGAFVTLWASVTPAATVAAGSVKTLLLTAVSAADAAKTDVVAAAVTAATTYRPDLLLRTSAESSYTGNGIYNTTGSGQAKAQTVAAGKTATYVFSLQNDGNATDSYALTTPAAVSGWTVRYYAAGQGEITAQITGAGWTTPSLARGAAQGLWVTVTPASTVASGAACSILLTAVSTGDAAKKDAVSVVTTKQ